MSDSNFATIAEAFSRTAEKYDQFADDHPHLTRMRHKVYAHLTRFAPPGARILELNAGTGTDAVYLAQQGYSVHATDIAPGMLGRLQNKVARLGLGDRLTVQTCSFLDLDQVQGGRYDVVFSDFGGLNCIPDLKPAIESLPAVLRPGGLVTWVLMPPVCLWELATVVTGNVRLAFRRLSPRGARAHLEGLYFQIYYFTPQQVITTFGSQYQLLALEGLSVITPTGESKNLAKRFPRLYRGLCWLDDRLSPKAPWWGWGDFFIITFRYQPGS
ncbi:MAG TPA: methyltransferase domain-containing protein [Anaerolineales bacterium]|nr:methyltransferase domain-containing protein [Anaerolineales bacterium]